MTKFSPDLRIETLPQLRKRHRNEVNDTLRAYSEAGYTQTEAAKELDCSMTHLNNLVTRNGIQWRVKKQGKNGRLPDMVLDNGERVRRYRVGQADD